MNRYALLAGKLLLAALACVPPATLAQEELPFVFHPITWAVPVGAPATPGVEAPDAAAPTSPVAPPGAEGSGGPPVRIGKPKEIVVVGSRLDAPVANRLLGVPGSPTPLGSGVARYHLENAWPTKSGTERRLASPQQLPTAPAMPVAGQRR